MAAKKTVTIEHIASAKSDAVVWVAGDECGCDEMSLFANRGELEQWRRDLGKPEGSTLSLADATKHGVEVFGSRLAPPAPEPDPRQSSR